MDVICSKNKQRMVIYNGKNYVATINVNTREKKFSLCISQYEYMFSFNNSNQLKNILNSLTTKISLPQEIYEMIDSWAILFIL